jgi:hypothetical protein
MVAGANIALGVETSGQGRFVETRIAGACEQSSVLRGAQVYVGARS